MWFLPFPFIDPEGYAMDRFCLRAFWSAMLPLSRPDHQEIDGAVAFKTGNWS
jgi:hypothetical protein